MKFFVLILALGFATNLHADPNYLYGEGAEVGNDGGLVEAQKPLEKAGTGFDLDGCNPCDAALKNQRNLFTDTTVTTTGENKKNQGTH